MKIAVVLGTRPEAIKMCPVIHALRGREGVTVRVILSGQHRELAQDVLAEFSVTSDADLAVMRKGQGVLDVTQAVLAALPPVLLREAPDAVLVHGDTSTAFAAATAAFSLGIPVGHVEAGLRTYCHTRPFPEEFNRRAIAAAATLHFAPTRAAKENLLREGVEARCVYCVGNTVVDALRYTVRADWQSPLLPVTPRFLLFTCHRRETEEGELCGLFRAISRLAGAFSDLTVLYPVHPRVAAHAHRELAGAERVVLLPPLDTVSCHNLMARATLILTDSGGMQEEACALGIPTLVLRRETERPEGVETGVLRLVGTDGEGVFREAAELLASPLAYAAMRGGKNPYGDGRAAERIADILVREIGARDTRVPPFSVLQEDRA